MIGWLEKYKVGVFLALLWAALCALCLLFPYTGDDWAWGSSVGEGRLAVFFANYNGRYLGNLLVMALTHNAVLRSVVVSAVLVAIVYELYAVAGKRRFSTLVVAAVLLMLVHYRIGAQAIVWVSGFTNYAVPALLVLVYVHATKGLLESGGREVASVPRCAGMFALAFANGLFMENITLFNVAIGFVMVVYCRVARGFWSKMQLAFLVGAVAGAAVMFANGAYWAIAAGEDSYRSVSGEGSGSPASHLLDTMTYYLVVFNWGIPVCLLMVLACRLLGAGDARKGGASGLRADSAGHAGRQGGAGKHGAAPKPSPGARAKAADVVLALVLLGVSMLSVYCVFFAALKAGGMKNIVVAAASLAFVAALVWYAVAHRDEGYARVCLLLIACVAIIAAPLLVVNPIGPRNFFPTYVLECAIACCMWDALVNDDSKVLSLVLVAVLVAVLVRWFDVYVPVHKADTQRNAEVAAAVARGDSSLKVNKLPASGYVHCPDPTEGVWETRYKLFYGVPDDFDITM